MSSDGTSLLLREWKFLLRISMVGFLVNCQPSEPFLTQYLQEVKHLSSSDIESYVWPWDTYGSFGFLIPVAIMSESRIGYKGVILIGLICRLATRLILLFGNSLELMSFMQVTYAMATSTNTIYFAYAFISCRSELHTITISSVYYMYHFGNVIGSLLGQTLVSYFNCELKTLFYVSLVFTSVGVVWFLLLLPGPISDQNQHSLVEVVRSEGFSSAMRCINKLYKSKLVRLWTIWWICCFAASNIVSNYYQNQLYEIDSNGKFGYGEAGVETGVCIGAALVPFLSFFFTKVPSQQDQSSSMSWSFGWSYAVIVVGTAVASSVLMWSTTVKHDMWKSIVLNSIAMGIISFQKTCGSSCIAMCLSRLQKGTASPESESPRYSIVFSVNSFIALGLATITMKSLSYHKASTTAYYRTCFFALIALICFSSLWYWCSKSTPDDDDEFSILQEDESNTKNDDVHANASVN